MATFLKALTTVYSANIAKAIDFYGRLLGFEETYRFPYAGEPEHVEFRVGGTTLAVSSASGLRSHGLPPVRPAILRDRHQDGERRCRRGGAARRWRHGHQRAAGQRGRQSLRVCRRPGWQLDLPLPEPEQVAAIDDGGGPPLGSSAARSMKRCWGPLGPRGSA